MKDTFRQSMQWFHTWSSLVLGWLLFFIFLTGTIGYFKVEITRWMQPELPMASTKFSNEQLANIAVNYLKKEASNSKEWEIILPDSRDSRLILKYYAYTGKKSTPINGHGNKNYTKKILDPQTKQPVKVRETGGGEKLYQMHYALHYLDKFTSRVIVGFAGLLMLISLITGIIIHINIFKDFFTFRQDKNIRSWIDIHIVTAIIAIPFHIIITYSGLAFFFVLYMPMVSMSNYDGGMKEYIQKIFPSEKQITISETKKPLSPIMPIIAKAQNYFNDDIKSFIIINQGDSSAIVKLQREDTTLLSNNKKDMVYFSGVTGKIIDSLYMDKPKAIDARSVLTGLHRGLFADIYVRWLFFLSGILGTVMIASGLIIWIKKRRKNQANTLGFKIVDNLNIATIAGLPVAISGYFWANRLIPIDTLNRASLEMDILFMVWGAVSLFSVVVNSKKVWHFLFYLASLLYALLPISNFILTDKDLVTTISYGDWVLVWVDLTFLSIGIIFGIIGYKVDQRYSKKGIN